jgi:hypothetical protein
MLCYISPNTIMRATPIVKYIVRKIVSKSFEYSQRKLLNKTAANSNKIALKDTPAYSYGFSINLIYK